jgi:hypothetical protein
MYRLFKSPHLQIPMLLTPRMYTGFNNTAAKQFQQTPRRVYIMYVMYADVNLAITRFYLLLNL